MCLSNGDFARLRWAGRLTARPARDIRSAMSAALTVEREQVETKPPKRQPAAAHRDRFALDEGSPFLLLAAAVVQHARMDQTHRCASNCKEAGSVQTTHDLGATLSHGAPHEGPGVGRRVARLGRVRCRAGRSDPSPAQGLAAVKPPQRATPARISAVDRPPITLTRGDDSGRGCLAFEFEAGRAAGEDLAPSRVLRLRLRRPIGCWFRCCGMSRCGCPHINHDLMPPVLGWSAL